MLKIKLHCLSGLKLLSSQNSYIEVLTFNVIVLGLALGRLLGSKSDSLMNGLVPLQKVPQRAPSPLLL